MTAPGADDTWADRLGERAFDMIWSGAWGALGWAAIGAVIGAFVGALPTDIGFVTSVVGCAGIGFIAWWAVGLTLGLVAIGGWIVELVALFVRWVLRRLGSQARSS